MIKCLLFCEFIFSLFLVPYPMPSEGYTIPKPYKILDVPWIQCIFSRIYSFSVCFHLVYDVKVFISSPARFWIWVYMCVYVLKIGKCINDDSASTLTEYILIMAMAKDEREVFVVCWIYFFSFQKPHLLKMV